MRRSDLGFSLNVSIRTFYEAIMNGQLNISRDDRTQVVEVQVNAVEEAAKRRYLLRLPELLF